MNLYSHSFLALCSAILIYVCIHITKFIWKTDTFSDPLLLTVGILSARKNFDLREAIRSTWLKQYLPGVNSSIKAWFIVGIDDCKVPPEYRLSEYRCQKWNISSSGLISQFYTSHKIHSKGCSSNLNKVFRQGFSFKVNHPLLVKKLGILSALLIPNVETKVAILDIQSKEIVIQTNISQKASFLENGYFYENVETVLLPKNYEGMVLVEGYLKQDACANIQWNDGGGVITFNRIYSSPSHSDSSKFSNEIYSAASIYFTIHDLNGLKTILLGEEKITSEWLSDLEEVNKNLQVESDEKKDILFINVTDTYRNLPIKLLLFYKWIYENHQFSYVMKTDDDTVVDISQLVNHMKNHSTFNPEKKWIWSWFRNDWPVNFIGKWADYDYRSSLYPSFPCGAAYIMSHKTVQWLSMNADYLFPYQGEDVSMGIWLSAIKANFIDDKYFECDFKCSDKSYNRAQLTKEDIYEIWSIYQTCQNLCSCG